MYNDDIGKIIDQLQLIKHPEGGYFREVYRSEGVIKKENLPSGFKGDTAFSTSIYFLLPGNEYSAFHRIKSDEIWHFYKGSSATIHVIDKEGAYKTFSLGPLLNPGMEYQLLIPAGVWFGATVDDAHSYTLAGCTVAPGFEFDDFEIGKKELLLKEYPEHEEIIKKICN